jgi:hypothetical protein
MLDGGAKKTIISRYYNYSYSIVIDTINKEVLCDNGHFLPRTGRPKCYSDTKERLILYYLRRFPKHIYAEVIKAYRIIFKKDMVKKILKVHGIKN